VRGEVFINRLPSCYITYTSSRIFWSFHASYRVPSLPKATAIAPIAPVRSLHRDRMALPYHKGRRLEAATDNTGSSARCNRCIDRTQKKWNALTDVPGSVNRSYMIKLVCFDGYSGPTWTLPASQQQVAQIIRFFPRSSHRSTQTPAAAPALPVTT